MIIETNTDLIPFIDCGNYWNDRLYMIKDDCIDEYKNLLTIHAINYINDTFKDIDTLKGMIASDGKLICPREYNFSDDIVTFNLSVPDNIVDTILSTVDEGFYKWLDNFKSYDGFITFMPTNKEKFIEYLNNPILNYRPISQYIYYQLINDGGDFKNDFNDDVLEMISQNGYEVDYE